MASKFQHRIDDGSDKECRESCNLKYGISEIFNINVIEQQHGKPSKSPSQPRLFEDPNKHADYKHMMGDDLLTTFDDESDKAILQ